VKFPVLAFVIALSFFVAGCQSTDEPTNRDENIRLLKKLKSSKSDEDARQRLLEDMLSSHSDKAFNYALSIHGSIRADEIPTLSEAARSWRARKRYNAVRLLSLGPKEAQPVLRELAANSNDVRVWAISLKRLFADKDPAALKIVQSRSGMIKKALEDENPLVLSIGLKAAVMVHYPGIKEILSKRLNHPNWRVRVAVVTAIDQAEAKEFEPQLRELLFTEKDPGVSRSILKALFKSEDQATREALLQWLKKADRYQENAFFNSIEGSPAKWVKEFLFAQARNPELKYHRDALWELSSWVFAFGNEPDVEFVQLCADIYKRHWPLPAKNRVHSMDELGPCQRMLNKMAGKKIKGDEAVVFMREWLSKQM